MAYYGYGLFDTGATAIGNGTAVSVGPVTPASAGEIALFGVASLDGLSLAAPAGWHRAEPMVGLGNIFAQLITSTSPFTAMATVTSGFWAANLLLFAFGSSSITATGTSVTVNGAGTICTINCSNSFIAGTKATMSGFSSATFLNGNTYTLLTATSSQITFTISHAAYGPTSDSGSIYDIGLIQTKQGNIGAAITLTNNVTAGSTLLYMCSAADNSNNNYGWLQSVSDSHSNGSFSLSAAITATTGTGTNRQYVLTCNPAGFVVGMPITMSFSTTNSNLANYINSNPTLNCGIVVSVGVSSITVSFPFQSYTYGSTADTGTVTGPSAYNALTTLSNPGGGNAQGGSVCFAWVPNAAAGATTITPVMCPYSGLSGTDNGVAIEFAQGSLIPPNFTPQVGAFLVGL